MDLDAQLANRISRYIVMYDKGTIDKGIHMFQ